MTVLFYIVFLFDALDTLTKIVDSFGLSGETKTILLVLSILGIYKLAKLIIKFLIDKRVNKDKDIWKEINAIKRQQVLDGYKHDAMHEGLKGALNGDYKKGYDAEFKKLKEEDKFLNPS